MQRQTLLKPKTLFDNKQEKKLLETTILVSLLTKQMTLRKTILPLLLSVQTIYCWNTFHKAQFLQYDDDYGLLIHGFIISLATLITLTIIWFSKRQLVRDNKIPVITWTITGSPITFFFAAIYYREIFGATLSIP